MERLRLKFNNKISLRKYPINDSGPAGGNGSDGWQQDNKPPKISIYRSESLSASANVLAPQQQQHAVSAPSSYSAGLLHQQHQQPLHFQYQQPPQHASIHIHHQPQLHHQFSQAASTSTPVAPQSAQNNITAIIVSSAVSGNQIKDVPTGGASIAVTSAAVAPVITSPSASASSISISSAANVMTPTAAITSMDLQTAVGSEKEHRRKATSPSSHTSTSNGDSSGSTSSSQQGQQSSLSSSAAALSLSARFEFDKVVGAGRPYGTIFGFRRNNGVILSDGPGGDIIPPSVTPLMTSGGVLDGVEDNSTETLSDAQAEAAVFSLTDEKSLENSICTASAEEEGVNLTSMSTLDSDSAAVSMAKLNVSLAAMKLDDATTSGKNILNNMTNSISGASTSTTASSSLPDLTVYQKKIGNPAVEKTVGSTVTPELSYSFAARRNGGGVNFGYHYNGKTGNLTTSF